MKEEKKMGYYQINLSRRFKYNIETIPIHIPINLPDCSWDHHDVEQRLVEFLYEAVKSINMDIAWSEKEWDQYEKYYEPEVEEE
tara:strand:+ start:18752 stop:19003 length:252 start_codon:yes stop_codon:yes gene_type:complete